MKTPLTPFTKPWLRCIGSDRMSTMLRQEYWDRFDQVQGALGFEFLRCHGLLGDDLGVVRTDEWEGTRRVFYNFSYLDQIFDTMLARNVRPFVELGFMPKALASGTETVFWWEGNITPPSDWGLWTDLIRALFVHWRGRYGAEEVRRWPVEVWNEPNLTQFWSGADQKAYFRLYETTVGTIKDLDPAIRVGGPAICGGSDHWIDDFLGFVKEKNLPLDFFTRHLYTAQTPVRRTPEVLYHPLFTPNEPVAELRRVRAQIDAAGFADLELHITEFNTSYHPLAPVHDTPLNAAYLARLLSESGDLVQTLSYWTFSDLFEEADVPRSFFHGGFGLLARGGVPKPTFHLFSFFARLGSQVLSRTSSTLATLRDDGTVALAAWNPVQDPGHKAPLGLEVSVPWETEGPVLVRRHRIHETAANPWALWVALGRPRFPDQATVEVLREAAHPAVEVAVLVPGAGQVDLKFSLERNEVTLLELLPFLDESPSYLGLDDALIDGYQTGVPRKGHLS